MASVLEAVTKRAGGPCTIEALTMAEVITEEGPDPEVVPEGTRVGIGQPT